MLERNFGTEAQYRQLQKLLTVERMGSYYAATSNNLLDAFKLYEWNMAASAAVMHTSGMVEVLVRNALDESMNVWQRSAGGEGDWLDLRVLDDRARKDIAEARRRASQRNATSARGKVIAEISFGFWRYLVASRYLTTIWMPAARHAFPHGPADPRQRRFEVEAALKGLHLVRNRAAHHEPIHKRNLMRDLETSVRVAGWIDPAARDWIAARSTMQPIVESKPTG